MKKMLYVLLILSLLTALPGCAEQKAAEPSADTICLLKTEQGIELASTGSGSTYADVADYALALLKNARPDSPEPSYEESTSIFALTDAPAPAYGRLIPGQPREDTMAALFNTTDLPQELQAFETSLGNVMQSPVLRLSAGDSGIWVSGIFFGMPFYYYLVYSDSTATLVIDNGGNVGSVTDEKITLKGIRLYFCRYAYEGRELESFVMLRDGLTALLGPAENYPDMRYNPYVDYTLEDMQTLEDFPDYIGVGWNVGSSGTVVLRLSFFNFNDIAYAELTLSLS